MLAAPVSRGLGVAALVVLVAEVWRQFCRSDGLGEAHFEWSESSLRTVRRWIGRYTVPVAVLAFAVAAMSAMDDPQAALLGRLALVVCMVTGAVPLYRLLDPRAR